LARLTLAQHELNNHLSHGTLLAGSMKNLASLLTFSLHGPQTFDTVGLHKKGGDPVRIPLAIWTCEVIVT
jgi:hypothetical protein